MICIYNQNETDFTSLGLGVISPTQCTISENAGGAFELSMEYPVTNDMRFTWLENGRIIKAYTPMRETPLTEINTTTVVREIYSVYTGSGIRLYLRTGPNQSSRGIHAYKVGTEVAVVDKSAGSWWKVIVLDGGATGYMYSGNLNFVRNETEVIQGDKPSTVIKPQQYREQLFRIYKVEKDSKTGCLSVEARHITYDLVGNVIVGDYVFENKAANVVVQEILARCVNTHDFNIVCTSTTPISGDYTNKGLMEALLDPDEGIVALSGSKIIRDNYDIFIIPDEERDLGVTVRSGKNLIGVQFSKDESNVVTRIIPIGQKKNGDDLYIDSADYTDSEGYYHGDKFIDSTHVSDYAIPHAKAIDYHIKVGQEGFSSETDVKNEIIRLAIEDFKNGCDLEQVSLDVDFVMLGQTDEYRRFASLQTIHLYDTVHVIYGRMGISAAIRANGYEYDAILKRYKSMSLGDVGDVNDTVYSYNMNEGSVITSKIARHAVGSYGLADGSVGPLKIPAATIGITHIGEAAIDSLNAEALNAQVAYINDLTAQTIDTDSLTAAFAHLFELIADNIQAGTIEAETITAAMARLNNASITSADIDFAQIKDALIDQLITHDAVADRYFIEKLQVRNLQVLEQTVGSLIVKATDGNYYRLDIDADNGTVNPVSVTVSAGEIAAGVSSDGTRSILETNMTVDDLSASNIKGINAIIDKITTDRLKVGYLFAQEALIEALDSYIIRASTIEALQNVLELKVGARNYLRNSENLDYHTVYIDYSEISANIPAIVGVAVVGSSHVGE